MVPMGGQVAQAQWQAQWANQAQIQQGNVAGQPNWEYDDRHKAAFNNKSPQGQDVYFHPRSEDGHLDLRIAEWKGKHCFYQGPEDYSQQDYNRAAHEGDIRTQEGYGQLDEDRRRRDDWVRENDHNAERYDHRSRRDVEEYEYNDKYRQRDHYDRKYSDEKYHEGRKHQKHDLREQDSYNSEYDDYYDHRDTYARRDKYRDRDRYNDHDRDYYDSKDRRGSREKDYYQRREEDRYYDEQKRKDRHYDRRADDHYDRREKRDRDVHGRRREEAYTGTGRAQYDSDVDEHRYKERDRYYRYRDAGDDRDDEYRQKDYKSRERYERLPVDTYDGEDRHKSRDTYRSRDRYRDLRSISADTPEEYPKRDRRTHCEEWVEEQKKLALRDAAHSYEDPGVYRLGDEQERGYESSTGSAGSKRSRKPVYVGSLDRNSFYRKTAPSAMRKSQYATTTRKQNKGKHEDTVM